jgi:hypothetical protein
LELSWLKCVSGSRALQLTSSGRAGLSEIFQIEINSPMSASLQKDRIAAAQRNDAMGQ